jgi:tetratricopeptide (TPR) repeat protein
VTRARLGDSASAYESFRRFRSRGAGDASWKLPLALQLEDYETLEREVRPFLASSYPAEWSNGAWSLLIALRNQGRLREAWQLHRTGTLPGFPTLGVKRTSDDFNEGILTFERGDGRASAAVFARRLRNDMTRWAPGYRARHLAWNGTLQAMGLAAAHDTAALRPLADSVERWGQGSSYGRDRKAHHYVRGLVLASAGRHQEAAGEFQAAIHSPSLGFTRVNYELARCLLKLDRPREAVATLRSALHGTTDASNLYITRTELHELLAESFDRAGLPDSAAHHYRLVVRAWRRADPEFHDRRNRALAWLKNREQGPS